MTHAIDQAIFDVAKVLEVPVLILALLALAAVIVECGAFAIELRIRHRRHVPTLTTSAALARTEIEAGKRDEATKAVASLAWSASMGSALTTIVDVAGSSGGETRIAKALADFDWDAQRRLGRTRLLVRAGPALGLMGTLIPLSPALDGLANGQVDELAHNLRVAFSVTVLGLLVGAIAYGLSLYRDRLYGQDLSDLEYVAAVLTDTEAPALPAKPQPSTPTPAKTATTALNSSKEKRTKDKSGATAAQVATTTETASTTDESASTTDTASTTNEVPGPPSLPLPFPDAPPSGSPS